VIQASPSRPGGRPAGRPAGGWLGPSVVAVAVDTVGVLPVLMTGALAVQLGRDLDLDAGTLGIVYASYFAAAAAFSTPLGKLSERYGPETALRVGTLINVLALLAVVTLAHSAGALMACLLTSGVGTAFTRAASTLLLARAVRPGRQGLALAIKHCSIPAGALLAGIAVPIALAVGWRWAYGAVAVASLLVAATIPRRTTQRPATSAETGRADLSTALLVLFAASLSLGSAAAASLGTYTVSTAVDAGMSEGAAGILVAVGSVVGLVSRVAVGYWTDHRSGSQLDVAIGMIALGAAAFVLLGVGSPAVLYLAVPFAFATGWSWLGTFNLAIVRLNPDTPGAAVGITQTGAFTGAIAGPIVLGQLARNGSFTAAWLAAAGLSLAAVAGIAMSGLLARRATKSI
jgi:predicted MFS family arabinose efflux permease